MMLPLQDKSRDNSFQISPIGKFTIDEGQTLSFSVKIADGTTSNVVYSLGTNVPFGVKINPTTGLFSWTPTDTQGAKSYTFDIVAKRNSITDRQSVTITVNDVIKDKLTDTNTKPSDTLPTQDKPKEPVIPAPFVDKTKDPQSYVDRYNDETIYKKWFDDNYPQYSSIAQAVGYDESKTPQKEYGFCGTGTKLIGDVCTIIDAPKSAPWWKFW